MKANRVVRIILVLLCVICLLLLLSYVNHKMKLKKKTHYLLRMEQW